MSSAAPFLVQHRVLFAKQHQPSSATETIWHWWQVEQVQKAVWQQQKHTWSLLAVLYAAISDTSVAHLPDSPRLVDMQRRANLSRWLQVFLKCQLVKSALPLFVSHATKLVYTALSLSFVLLLFVLLQGCGIPSAGVF